MSVEGSVSSDSGSKIRQFGLYRSIDAKTEEFLRLSRKRQIKQGCVCAAVSTAITVTVVVVVILVYEFSLNSNVNIDSSLRTNWFGLTNDTTEDGFQSKYTKSGLDKTTLTLLPILLKALKKNVFLENLIEDQANTSSYERSDTTEYFLDKYKFSRNWFRMPSSKIYAIEYKTAPISYFKSPSKKVEYFTKIRKIRDYQRIVQYVDKMISEKVNIGSTKPMMTDTILEEKSTVKPPRIKTQLKYKKEVVLPNLQLIKTNTDDYKTVNYKKKNCNCSIKFGEILKKLFSGIQTLLSVESNNKQKPSTYEYKTSLKSVETSPTFTEIPQTETDTIIEPTTQTKIKNNDYYNKQENDITSIKNKIEKIHDLMQKISWKPYKNKVDDETELVQSTIINSYIDTTNKKDITQPSTKPMKSDKLSKNAFHQTSELNILLNSNRKLDKVIYNEHAVTPTTVIRNDLFNNNKLNIVKNETFLQLKNKQQKMVDNSIDSTYKYALDNISETYTEKITRKKNIVAANLNNTVYHVIENDGDNQINTRSTIVSTSTPETRFNYPNPDTNSKYPIIETSTFTKLINKIKYVNKLEKISSAVEEESETLNNFTQEDDFKQIEFSAEHPIEGNSSLVNKNQTLWEELKTENIPAWKSMLPNNRPVYLQIHRNNWKRDEQQEDYDDLNFINNYDLPNV